MSSARVINLGGLERRNGSKFLFTLKFFLRQKLSSILRETKISFQGSWEELKADRPDLFERHGYDPRPSESGLVESRTAQERWKLLKNVTKFGIARNFPRQVRNIKLVADKPSMGMEIEMSRTRKLRGKNSLARVALMRSAENAGHQQPHHQDRDRDLASESKKLLLSERFSILSFDLDQPRTRGGEASFALRRMLSTDSTTGMLWPHFYLGQ